MAPITKVDIKWSSSKMEGGEVLKTMECLRRRLLAERQASSLAKEEEELMGKRSKELARKITEQIQMRTKAEKKLQLLRKKLESLNLSPTMVNSEPSISSGICDEDELKTPIAAKAIGEVSNSEEANPNARGSTISSSSAAGEESNSMDDSLAIVAVNSPAINEVLHDLKVAGERIQRWMEICELNMIKVSPV